MKTFDGLAVSSKFAICGLPIRVDTYKNCSFGCTYCFANNRKVMEFSKEFQAANIPAIERRLKRIFADKKPRSDNFLDTLILNGITWHAGGMSDPFQPIEGDVHATEQLVDVTNKYNVSILFSTKSDNLYGANIRPDLHTFQFSVSNVDDRRDIEPGVPTIEQRYRLYRELKQEGYKVGIRIQPFIPNVTNLNVVEMFHDADHFTLEGLKLVPQNAEHKNYLLSLLDLKSSDFTQMGLLNLMPQLRQKLYKPFVEYFEAHSISYSIADNDMHQFGTDECCCGDALVRKSTNFNNTTLIKRYGEDYAKEQVDEELFECGVKDCRCCHLFTSNRTEGCISVQDFYDKRFYRASSPFSPAFLYHSDEPKQLSLFEEEPT